MTQEGQKWHFFLLSFKADREGGLPFESPRAGSSQSFSLALGNRSSVFAYYAGT